MSDAATPFSPGLAGVIGAETAVSLVDGANGRLLYRGYPIEEVVSKGSYAAVLDLLLTGEWHPNATLEPVRVPPAAMAALRLLPAHAHPMDALRTAIILQNRYLNTFFAPFMRTDDSQQFTQ